MELAHPIRLGRVRGRRRLKRPRYRHRRSRGPSSTHRRFRRTWCRARILIAFGSAGSLKDAAEQLGTIRRLSEQCRFIGQTIEVAVLQTLVLEKQGRGAEALDALEEAVAMAAPGGWVRPFVEAGPSMAGLLERLAGRSDSTEQLRAILEALRPDTRPPASTPSPSAPAGEIRLQESLTRRELEILDLVAQRLQNKEIASRLFVSVDTV
jgi:LuxR family maltose regulon positive regulatory protein